MSKTLSTIERKSATLLSLLSDEQLCYMIRRLRRQRDVDGFDPPNLEVIEDEAYDRGIEV